MKKFIILPLIVLALASCENFFDEKELGNYGSEIKDVRNFSYTLTDADYASIASNATNIATVLNMAEDSSLLPILQAIGTNKYFSDTTVTADLVVPAFLAKKYPQLSEGTACEVFFRQTAEEPIYYSEFKFIREPKLSATPTSTEEALALLKAEVSTNNHNNWKYIINYTDDNAELFTLSGDSFHVYTNPQLNGVEVLPASVYKTAGTYGVNRHYIDASESARIINIYMTQKHPYAKAEDKYLIVYYEDTDGTTSAKATELHFDGSSWNAFSAIEEASMSFQMKDAWKANTSTYLSEPFLGHGIGDFSTQNVLLTGDLTYVWYYSASYGMCASAYKSSTNNDSEAWLISPAIKLKKAKQPTLIFDQARKYGVDFAEECTVWVVTDYTGDITTSTKEQLPWNTREDGSLNVPDGSSWVFQSSDYMDMSAYNGKTVRVAFKYTSSTAGAATWEIKNLLVCEIGSDKE